MSDTIYRRDAIDALADYIRNVDKVMGTGHLTADDCKDAATSVFEELPSAQQEIPFEIQDILEYLDTVLHPIISPEHWNVYSELHDMISTLPSAEQKKGKWRRFLNDTFHCCECGRTFVVIQGEDHMNFCPNCGADMRGGDDE